MTSKYSILLPLAVLALIVALSFGQSTQFELWQDDNALIFKLQHLEEQAGVFGAGPLGLGAYRYIAVPYIPLYKLFGMNISLYYLWAIFFYFLASASVFFLTKQLTKSIFISTLSGSIFAAGFVGSDGILRLFNSIQTSYSVIFICATFFFLYRFTWAKRVKDYVLSVIFFLVVLETAFIRTQYFIFPTITFLVLFLNWRKKGAFWGNIFLLVPFLLVYDFVFSRSVDTRVNLIKDYVGGILSGKFDYTHSFFGSLGNIVVPQPINEFLFSLAGNISLDYTNRLLVLELVFLILSILLINLLFKGRNKFLTVFWSILPVLWFFVGFIYFQNSDYIFTHSVEIDIKGILSNFVGGLFLISYGAILLVLSRRNLSTSQVVSYFHLSGGQKGGQAEKILLVLLSWMLFNILAYSIYLPFSPLESIHRYLIHSFAAYAVLIPILIYYLWGKKMTIIISGFIIFSNIWFSILYQHNFIVEKSIPTHEFYKDLKEFLPEIPKRAILYFDVAENEVSQQQFRDFFSVASMPDTTAIAIRYGIDRYDFKMTQDFSEFISFVRGEPLDNAFSFFYDANGLKDTTSITRANLKHGGIVNLKRLDFNAQDILITTPVVLEFNARIAPNIFISSSCIKSVPQGQDELLLDYILSRDEFLKNVKVKTSSQEKYLASEFLIDGDKDTLWRGGRGWWHENEKEEIVLDMGQTKNIGQVVWVNGYANSTPTNYKIEVSVDRTSWQGVIETVGGSKKDNGMLVVEDFIPRPARFIKMTINSTFDNDAPAIGEIEAVESGFAVIDKSKVKTFESEISCIKNKSELEVLRDFINKRGIKVGIVWETEKRSDNVLNFLAKADGIYHKYSLLLPAGGIKMKNLRIEPANIPAQIGVTDMRIIYPNILQLRRLEEAGSKR